ncbi:NAD(P)/FAD-dependent oxidoreductase [Streptococcus catagoni]|uniref:NAD(P)/FAD-dependent oxidoreductase n=1 Tax=Streptococcus catagoni TaxID=2654874 RepID=UPI00140906FF|nr:FAD/NAD(P)-binding oxidoreductase [Streptococcus catagoni]
MKSNKEKIHIIGASFAGLACAEKLIQLRPDLQITFIDKERQSHYIPNGLNHLYRQKISELSQSTWESSTLKDNDNVRFLVEEVVSISSQNNSLLLKNEQGQIREETYQTLICAMGAKPESDYIKGADHPKVVTTKYFRDSQKALELIEKNENIAIIGAGLIGLDLAYSLSLQKKSITLIEAADHLDSHQTDPEMLPLLLKEIEDSSVLLKTGSRVKEIREEGEDLLLITDQKDEIRADLVVLAVNFRPNSHLLQGQVDCLIDKTVKVNAFMQTTKDNIYAIGDLISSSLSPLGQSYYTALINHAVKSGQILAYHLAGFPTPKLQTTRVVGSFHFDYYRSSVGMTEEEASIYRDVISIVYKSDLGKKQESPIWIKLIATEKDGLLIGAQIISRDNSLLLSHYMAQAIQNKLKASDLAFEDFIFARKECELAYQLHQAALMLFEKRQSL